MLSRRSLQHVDIINRLKEVLPLYKIIEEFCIGDKQYLDIYIPRLCSGIEVNGKQHYCFSKFLHGTYDMFEVSKFLDRKKAMKCLELGIGLYVVKYDDMFDVINFIDFATNHLNKLGGYNG